MIEFSHVYKNYGGREILADLNLKIEEGKFVVLIGASGCGKTTTLKMINRLITPDKGDIFIDEKNIKTVDKVNLRRHIGYVIQQIGLFPNMTVAQNIAVVPRLLKYPEEKCDEIVSTLLQMVHMERYANQYPSEMSGGQQQRIGVLRALAGSPPIVLMDEPFGALDPLTREELQDELKSLQQKLKKTIIFVTHDMNEALKLADIIIFMNEGKIVQMASPEEMLEHPANEMVETFLGKHSFMTTPSKVEDYMRTEIYKCHSNRGIRECVEMMARNNIDSLLVTDENDCYIGTVSIGDIRKWGKDLKTITSIVRKKEKTVYIGEEAKEIFEYLLDTSASYAIVLNQDETIAGIINKTSVARSISDNLWGDGDVKQEIEEYE